MPDYRHRTQPARGLYLTYQVLSTALIRIPAWILFSLPKSNRPRKSWDIRRVIWLKLIRHVQAISMVTGPLVVTPDHREIKPGKGVQGVWIEPVPDLISEDLENYMSAAAVSPVGIPGYWITKRGSSIQYDEPPRAGEKVILNFHGGAYIRLSAHPKDPTSNIPRGLLKYIEQAQRLLSVEYRLSSTDPYPQANAFPAALLDALAGYNHLIKAGFAPTDIIVCGDSAGGNLALALTRYLVENRGTLRLPDPPGSLILLSPWADIGTSHHGPGSSAHTNAHSDYVGLAKDGGLDYAIAAFLRPHGLEQAETNRYISPGSLNPAMSVSFAGFPRTFLVGGGAETLIDQIRTLKERMVKDLGEGNGVAEGEGKVRYFEAPDGIHDYVVFSWHEPERSATLKEISKWVSAAAAV